MRTRIIFAFATLCFAITANAMVPRPMTKPQATQEAKREQGHVDVTISRGDTLSKVLQKAGVSSKQAHAAIDALREVYSPTRLQVGQSIRLHLQDEGLVGMRVELPYYKHINVMLTTRESYIARVKETKRYKRLISANGDINSSLFDATSEAGIPIDVVMNLIRTYSYDVDFQRDIQKGDGFEVLYEQYFDSQGKKAGSGHIIYASLAVKDEAMAVYRYTTSNGDTAYYDELGRSVRKSFLRTPVDGARITSGYGNRIHPILGYNKMHRGVDFGAPKGTPVYAAAKGVVHSAKRYGSYGNYIRVNHANGYATAYAHLNGFAKGIRKGKKVTQGQVIGYVGSTGRSTGPHLHYEVLQGNRQINPMSLKTVAVAQLKSLERGIFYHYKRQVASLMKQDATKLASAQR